MRNKLIIRLLIQSKKQKKNIINIQNIYKIIMRAITKTQMNQSLKFFQIGGINLVANFNETNN